MPTTSLYCSVCRRHTPHVTLPMEYATACSTCGTHTSQLMRVQASAIAPNLKSPDHIQAEVVDNTPTSVTFYIGSGAHKGYYDYDKATGKKTIRKA